MAINILSSSTLSVAITAETSDFTVASTSGILAGMYLVVQGTGGIEAMKVTEIPVSGRVKVNRGVGGTRARAHKISTRFFFGDPDDFQSVRDGVVAGITGNSGDFADYLLPGSRYVDGAGNEYVLCEATAACFGGATVAISPDGNFTCAPLKGGTHQGSVGLCVDPGTSDQLLWVQVYGYNSYAQSKTATTGVTSAYIPTATTTVSSPDVGLEPLSAVTTGSQYFIYGMFIVGAGSSAVTSATSSTGYAVPVFLNYPYINARLQSDETSNS
jgi:hypothetical protein